MAATVAGRGRVQVTTKGEQPLIIGIEPQSRGFVDNALRFLDACYKCICGGFKRDAELCGGGGGREEDEFL